MEIFLVRHGEAAASWGQEVDPGLSELGRRQSEAAAAVLGRELDAGSEIISSPMQRAQETAEPLSRLLRLPVRQDNAFREIPSPVPLPQRQAWLRRFMQEQWDGQSAELLTWRAMAFQRLLEMREPTAVFTHFLVINAVVGQILESSATLQFWPANGSITRLRSDGMQLEIMVLGDEMESVVN